MTAEHVRTLTERRDWLTARIAAKRSVGWETRYDERERDALAWAVPVIAAAVEWCRLGEVVISSYEDRVRYLTAEAELVELVELVER